MLLQILVVLELGREPEALAPTLLDKALAKSQILRESAWRGEGGGSGGRSVGRRGWREMTLGSGGAGDYAVVDLVVEEAPSSSNIPARRESPSCSDAIRAARWEKPRRGKRAASLIPRGCECFQLYSAILKSR